MFDIAPAARSLGTETAFDVLARAQALAAAGRDIVNLGIGQPDFKTADHIVEAAVKALRDGHHGYTPAPGIPALREAVAADVEQRQGLSVDPDRVVIVPGGKVTIWFACLMFGRPGVEIMYPDPGFPIYRSAAAFTGATPVPLPLYESDGFALRAETVAERLTPRTRLLIVNSPGNPTGGVMPADEIAKLAELLADHPNVAILSDEIYGQMTYGDVGHHSPAARARDRRPGDSSGRMVEDLRHDRLAPRLWHLAGRSGRTGDSHGRQQPFLCRDRQSVRRLGRPHRSARRRRADGCGV